jgi:peptidoglycan/LPS O-acetylase OafA/YrhL
VQIRDRSIDGLRGLCALSVLLFHALQEISTAHGYDWTWHIPLAHAGVNIFFVISGYLMIESARRHHTAGRFIWARIRRVYPTFIVLQVLTFSIGYATHAKGLGDPVYFVERFIFDALMLPGVLPIDPIQTVAWTLSFEAAFYLLVANMRRQPEWLIAIILLVVSTVFEWWDTFAFFALGIALRSGRIEPPKFLGWWPVAWFGTISYSFYLWHPIVLHATQRMVFDYPWAYLGASCVGTAIVAWCSWKWIEMPGQRWTTRARVQVAEMR